MTRQLRRILLCANHYFTLRASSRSSAFRQLVVFATIVTTQLEQLHIPFKNNWLHRKQIAKLQQMHLQQEPDNSLKQRRISLPFKANMIYFLANLMRLMQRTTIFSQQLLISSLVHSQSQLNGDLLHLQRRTLMTCGLMLKLA